MRVAVAVAGTGPLAAFVVRRLAIGRAIRAFDTTGGNALRHDGVEQVASAAALARDSDVIFICAESVAARDALFSGPQGLIAVISTGHVIVDLAPGDPDATRDIASELAQRGATLIDAPLHTENTETIDEASAILCGGPQVAVESLGNLLEAICPKVIYCGEAGAGHAAGLVVAAIAACNRLITYECAAMGVRNGLAIKDMAVVLNKSSGYNSASARVLPALASGGRTGDMTLGTVAGDLTLASKVAMRYGAPMAIATLVHAMVDAASNRLGPTKSIDDLAVVWEADGCLRLSAGN